MEQNSFITNKQQLLVLDNNAVPQHIEIFMQGCANIRAHCAKNALINRSGDIG